MSFPVDDQRIVAAEHELGQRFLADHRRRLRDHNGGAIVAELQEEGLTADFDPEWELFPVWDDTDRRRAARTAGHIVHETSEARSWPRFPSDALAIASNGTGDLLIVRDGGVACWDHETGETQAVRVSWNA